MTLRQNTNTFIVLVLHSLRFSVGKLTINNLNVCNIINGCLDVLVFKYSFCVTDSSLTS